MPRLIVNRRRFSVRRLVAGLLAPLALAAFPLLVAPGVSASVTVTSHFVWTSTPSNTTGDSTFINNFATNGRPGAVLFVTPNFNQGGVCGCSYDSNPIGVYYDYSASGNWAIFNENHATMVAGEQFNVLVVPSTRSGVFVQKATSSNSSGDSTFINSTTTNSKPSAKILVTQVWNPGSVLGIYNAHNVGVWYDNSLARWAVFQEDGSGMTSGASFNIMVGATASNGGQEIVQKAASTNESGDATFISNGQTTGNPNSVVFATPNFNPGGGGGTYDSAALGMWWDTTNSKAAVFNEDLSTMVTNAAFNVVIYSS